jgi:hypothetical protein
MLAEGTMAEADRAAERHTRKDGHPTVTIAVPATTMAEATAGRRDG